MAIFFDGRLYVTPAVMSRVDDSAMFNRNPAIGNILALIGPADGGEPKQPLRFGSASEAAAVLRGGDLLAAVQRAFAASPETPGPSQVVAMRVQPATRSTLTLNDGSAVPLIDLTSTVWGAMANRVNVTIANGSLRGKRVTVRLDGAAYEQDNIARQAATIRYSGAAATATVTVSPTNIVLAAPAGSTVATIAFADFPSVAAVVERIAQVSGWTASIADGSNDFATLNNLDFLSVADAKSADLAITANLQAIVEWFNTTPGLPVAAVKRAAVGTMPGNVTAFLAGAVTGNTTVQDYADCLTAMQSVDAQWVVPITGDAAVHALVAAHCAFASNILRRERRAICGTALATSDAAAITAARALNSDRVSLCHIGVFDYNAAGVLTLYPPFITAAMIAGGFAGLNPGNAMTAKALSVRGVERRLRNPTDTDMLLNGGVIPVEETPTGFRVVQSITTWLTNNNYNRREVSTGVAVDFTARAVRAALEPVKGKKNGPAAMVEALARVQSTLEELSVPEPAGLGVLVGNADNPPFKNVRVQAEGEVLRVEFSCSPVIPVNYIPITIFAAPFTGSVTA